MNGIWHDYSQPSELAQAAAVLADVAHVIGSPLVAGVFARDLHLWHRHGIPVTRATSDMDVAFAVPDWPAYETTRDRLLAGAFIALAGANHRLRHRTGMLVDIVPFGGLETSSRQLQWPPDGNPTMNAFGFREAYDVAHRVRLPGAVDVLLVSLPSLVMLKLNCWEDRHRRTPGRDAQDLWMLLVNYLDCGHASRLFEDFAHWSADENFDYEASGPRMLGHDLRREIGVAGVQRLATLLRTQSRAATPAELPNEMNRADPDRARRLLSALLLGLVEE